MDNFIFVRSCWLWSWLKKKKDSCRAIWKNKLTDRQEGQFKYICFHRKHASTSFFFIKVFNKAVLSSDGFLFCFAAMRLLHNPLTNPKMGHVPLLPRLIFRASMHLFYTQMKRYKNLIKGESSSRSLNLKGGQGGHRGGVCGRETGQSARCKQCDHCKKALRASSFCSRRGKAICHKHMKPICFDHWKKKVLLIWSLFLF